MIRRERPKYPAGGFHPVGSLGSLLKAWWTADAGLTDDGAGVISAWADQIAGISVTAATTARPTLGATSFNGRAGLTFDGTANCFVSTSFAALPNGAAPGEIWALFDDQQTGTGAGIIFNYGGAAAATDRSIQTTGAGRFFRVNDRTTNLTPANIFAFGRHVLQASWNGTEEFARIDGYQGKPGMATIASLNTGTTRLRIGAVNSAGAASFALGVLRHVMVTALLLPAQRMQLEAWLAWDGGISNVLPSSHPYKGRRP